MTQLETIYVIHHTHTDIGYTHDQPIVFDLHGRFIEDAIELAERYANTEEDHAFRWTVETHGVLINWLETASGQWIERFQRMERLGRIEVTAMFANWSALPDLDEWTESFRHLRRLRNQYGITIKHAMSSDVNGLAWPLADLLLDHGIESVSMAINGHSGGTPIPPPPNAFLWQGPSGRTIQAWNGLHYGTANDAGIAYREGQRRTVLEECGTMNWRFARQSGLEEASRQFEHKWLPEMEKELGKRSYPFPILMLQGVNSAGDNGSVNEGFSEFIRRWNEAGKKPRLVLATPSIWWDAMRGYRESLSTVRGDWSDYWTFGVGGSAYEERLVRLGREKLRTADMLAAVLTATGDKNGRAALTYGRYREKTWDSLLWFHEHTYTADVSVEQPYNEDTIVQWYHKAKFASDVRSYSNLLQRDGIAELARRIRRSTPEDLLVFNALPWKRRISGVVPHFIEAPRGDPADTTSARHAQDRVDPGVFNRADRTPEGSIDPKEYMLPPIEVPALGYAVVPRDKLIAVGANTRVYYRSTVENDYYRLIFDRITGGVISLYDKKLQREWADQTSEYPLHNFVHEEVANRTHRWPRRLIYAYDTGGWQQDWPAKRTKAGKVTLHRVYETPLGIRVVQHIEAEGVDGPLRQTVFLPVNEDYIEFESAWMMGIDSHPQANYIVFPFALERPTLRVDLGDQAMIPGVEQIAGTSRHFFTVQKWVDFEGEQCGMTIATPENPLVQAGGFTFGDLRGEFNLERAMLLGWVTNNYWETNFRAHQPGLVSSRYRLQSYAGQFDESRAHRLGREAIHAEPLLQAMEESADLAHLPETASLLQLSGDGVQLQHMKPSDNGEEILIRLYNASDRDTQALVCSSAMTILRGSICDSMERVTESFAAVNGVVVFSIPARRQCCIKLSVSWA